MLGIANTDTRFLIWCDRNKLQSRGHRAFLKKISDLFTKYAFPSAMQFLYAFVN